MKKYIIIAHHYWMSHKDWKFIEIECKDNEEAQMRADAYRGENARQFEHVDTTVLEIKEGMRIARKLTMKERIKGAVV